MVDSKSKSSADKDMISETQSMQSRKVKKQDEASAADKKKLKVLKQALKDERALK